MVKGQSRRIVVIRGMGKRLFEEAIFILREDAEKSGGYSAEDVVREAELAVEEYLGNVRRRGSVLRRALPVATGVMGILVGCAFWGMMVGW